MKMSMVAIPESRGRAGKYGELVEAILAAPMSQAVCVECESRAEAERVFMGVRAYFRPERGYVDPAKRLKQSWRGTALYLWLVPREQEVATRFVKAS